MTTSAIEMNGGDLDILRTQEAIEYEKLRDEALQRPTEAPTLLWRGAATTISYTTGAASWSIRAGLGVGQWGLSAGRRATHGIIGLNQTVLETVLNAAREDVNAASQVALRQEEAEYLVEGWITSLHSTLSAASIIAASGFFVAEHALQWTSQSSLLGLQFLNALFGSTETSRAVAAIVSLMRKELYKPGVDGNPSEISTFNLLTTVASFLFLQRSGRRQTEIEWRDAGGDVAVWDIVIDDRGFRADVIGTRRTNALITRRTSVVQSPTQEEPMDDFAAILGHVEDGVLSSTVALSAQDQSTLTDEEIKQKIIDQLPAGTRATITTDTMMVKTVKVNIQGSETTNIEAPPGMVMVSEHPNFDNSSDGQTITFRTASKTQSRAQIRRNDSFKLVAPPTSTTSQQEDAALSLPAAVSRKLVLSPPMRSSDGSDTRSSAQTSSSIVHNEQPTASVPQSRVANQKKRRGAVPEVPLPSSPRQSRLPQSSTRRDKVVSTNRIENSERSEKSGVFKKALKSLSPTQSSAALNRVIPGTSRGRSNSGSGFTHSLSQTLRPLTTNREASRKPIFHISTTQPTTPLVSPGRTTPSAEGQSGSYFTVHEKRRESTYSEIDTYSVHSNDSRPPSPTMSRTHLRASNSMSKTRSSTEISMYQNPEVPNNDDQKHHRRSQSFVPSLYSMGTRNTGEEALVLAPKTPVPRKSIFEDNKMLMALANDGKVPGQFPSAHLIWTLRRFVRFASAAYGERFLSFFGLSANASPEAFREKKNTEITHREHTSFSNHTGLPPETILKSSFLNPYGIEYTYAPGFSPIIHFVTIDLETKAIVLTCRGTLGFEDLLTDMACDYADIYWQGQPYKVHRGICESARRLMDSSNGNHIMAVLKASLEEYPEFGLVFVGHSLGGAVAAVLAIMLSEPSKHEPGQTDAPSFVTATKPKLLPSEAYSAASKDTPPVTLPSGRPIHVYAFGSPAAVSSTLRMATRGLITSIINANDIVPYLSLGTLHDFRAVAARLKEDFSGAFAHIRQRAASRILKAVASYVFPNNVPSGTSLGPPPPGNLAGDGLGEDTWMWNELAEMRKVMTNEKLYPPGEIFTLESTRVFDRNPDETTTGGLEQAQHYTPLGRPATRIQFKWVRDVEQRFNEVRFGRSMFHEHSPNAYENNMSALERGVWEDA